MMWFVVIVLYICLMAVCTLKAEKPREVRAEQQKKLLPKRKTVRTAEHAEAEPEPDRSWVTEYLRSY